MNAREQILSAVRHAISLSQTGPAPEVERNYRCETEHPTGSEPVIAEMIAALEDYKAQVVRTKKAGIGAAIADFLGQCQTVVVPPELPKSWVKAAGREGRKVTVDTPEAPLTNLELDGMDAVVTSSRNAVSLSGTIVLDGQPDQGRRAITLVPDTHVCVLFASTIHAVLPQAVAELAAHPERPLTWIAGPSATSDIELIRVDGVHGPRTLNVIIVDD